MNVSIRPLGSLAEISTGGTPERIKTAYWGGEIPWITTGDIDYKVIHKSSEKITKLGLSESAAKVLPKGTIVMAMYGQGATRGKVAILGIDAATNQACAAIVPKREKIDPGYLYSVLAYKYKEIRNLGHGGNQKNLNSSLIREIPIPVPPLSRQREIAAIAQTWATATEKLERLIVVKNLALRQLQKRLFDNPDWEQLRVADLFSEVTRKVDKLNVPVATISAGKGFLTQNERFNRVLAGRNLTNYTCLRRGEFAYNKGNSKTYEFGCAYLLTDYPELVIPNVYVSFAPKVPLVPEFYALWFEADLLKRQLRRVVNSGVRNDGLLNINSTTFFKLSLPAPNMREQRAISRALLATKEEFAILKKHLQALEIQKCGLMQKLLSGQWRLKLQESAVV